MLPDHIEYLEGYKDIKFIRPLYGKASICEIAGTIAKVFNIKSNLRQIHEEILDYSLLDSIDKLVLLIVDALSYTHLLTFKEKLTKKARFYTALTSTVPSTTPTAIVSIVYGITPLEHGILGYHTYFEKLGFIVNTLKFTPIINPSRESLTEYGISYESLIPCKTIFEILSDSGVKSVKILPDNLLESSYTNLTSKGANKVGYFTLADMFVKILNEIKSDERKLIVAYWWGLDTIQHMYGCDSGETYAELELFIYMLFNWLLNKIDSTKCRILITSDHGQVNVSNMIHLESNDEIAENLIMPPLGECRFFMLYPWDKDKLIYSLNKYYSEYIVVFDKNEVLKNNLFGFKGVIDYTKRIGEVIVACKEGVAFLYLLRKTSEEKIERLKALHGSLTEKEMVVPLLIF